MLRNVTKRISGRWLRPALGGIGVLLLAAVPALGLTALAPDLLPLGQGDDKGAAVSNGPLTFDAPVASLRKVRPAEPRKAGPDDAAVVLNDFQFTATQTVGQVLTADLINQFKTNPFVFFFLTTQIVPPLVNDFFAYYNSLTPPQQAALLLFIFAYLNSPVPSGTPTPSTPSH